MWGGVVTSEIPAATVGPRVCTLVMPEYRLDLKVLTAALSQYTDLSESSI